MDANQIIDAIGGTIAVAALCEVTSPAVSQWRTKGIPKARLMFLRAIRPEVFGGSVLPASSVGQSVPPREAA
jgi:hypothetical protein